MRSMHTQHRPRKHNGLRLVIAALLGMVIFVVAFVGWEIYSSYRQFPSPKASATTEEEETRDSEETLPADDGEIDNDQLVSVFDDVSAVSKLNPDLRKAVQAAATDAQLDGVEFNVNSGWRSPALQEKLLSEAIEEYGSREEAARWVATPETSAHVSGDAIDIGETDATDWLYQHGANYGLCQIYSNEPWHFELRPEAITDGCPVPYLDPTEDPRLQG